MPCEAVQSINTNNRGAESGTWLLSTQLSVGDLITSPIETEDRLIRTRMSSYFQRLDALRWTPYLDECIVVLGEKDEHPTDPLLIHLVKLQLVVEKAGQAPWHEERHDPSGSVRAPPIFYLKALQAQLQDFRTRIPPSIQGNSTYIHEIAPLIAYKRFHRYLAPVHLQYRVQSARDGPLESIHRYQWSR